MQSTHKLPGLVAALFLSCAAFLSYAEIPPFENAATAGQIDVIDIRQLQVAYATEPTQRFLLEEAPHYYAINSSRNSVFRSVSRKPDNTLGTSDFSAPIPQWKTIVIPQVIDPARLKAPSVVGVIVLNRPEDRSVPVPGAAWLFASGLIGLASIIKNKQRQAGLNQLPPTTNR